jgi:hypothetical protein
MPRIYSLANHSNQLGGQQLPSATIILLTNATRLEKHPSGLIWPICNSLSLLQPTNSRLPGNHEAESCVRSGHARRDTFDRRQALTECRLQEFVFIWHAQLSREMSLRVLKPITSAINKSICTKTAQKPFVIGASGLTSSAGSTKTAKIISAASAPTLNLFQTELGGTTPMIVFDVADLGGRRVGRVQRRRIQAKRQRPPQRLSGHRRISRIQAHRFQLWRDRFVASRST